MNTHFSQHHTSHGFALIEILVACSIVSISIFALFSAAQKGIEVSNQALRETQAIGLLQEGAEAVRSIRDTDWSVVSGAVDGTPYYLSFDNTSNVWLLSSTPTDPVDGIFNRTVVFWTANRDSNDAIASGGTPDSRTKEVMITVTFPSSHGPVSKSIHFYLADIFN